MEETSSDCDNVSTRPPSCNEINSSLYCTIWTSQLRSTKPIDENWDVLQLHNSNWQHTKARHQLPRQPYLTTVATVNKPCSLHFYVWSLSKKCHGSRNCCYTDWAVRSTCTCTQVLFRPTSCGRIISVPQQLLRAIQQAVATKKTAKNCIILLLYSFFITVLEIKIPEL
jgi:hypothetical protein